MIPKIVLIQKRYKDYRLSDVIKDILGVVIDGLKPTVKAIALRGNK
jgi:hypothetical protein